MLVRGIAKRVRLGETMTGLDIYRDVERRVQNLGVAQSAGRLALEQFLLVGKIPDNSFKLIAVDTKGRAHSGGNSSEAVLGVHSPYPQSHLLVMPDLAEQPGIRATRGYDSSTLYSSADGQDTFDVSVGFKPEADYDAVVLGISEAGLPGFCWRQDPCPINLINEAVTVWHEALELPQPGTS